MEHTKLRSCTSVDLVESRLELHHALAVEVESPNLNNGNSHSIRTLLACKQGPVAVDKEASTIRLTYFTAQETVPEYLRAHPHPLSPARSIIAETHLSYLDSQQVKPVPLLISNAHPFSASNAPSFSISNTPRANPGKEGPFRLRKISCDDCNNHLSTKIISKAQGPYVYPNDFHKLSLFNDLHYALSSGLLRL